ncbi:MAG TPA: cytochrome b N-terminal domain-containing protein [Terriglobia bacterium]|nr:cytochrome b N-terminal domain-containing protein [Terriglobia bacterium]
MSDSPVTTNEVSRPEPRAPQASPGWLDQRTGWKAMMHEFLDERVPGGARWAYVFGSGLLFIFLSQIVTGTFLALYYVPSADHAHTTVGYIIKVVWSGAFLRGVHSYGASIMIVLLVVHITQTFMFGSYKGRRELLWVSGCILFALVLGMAFTGYLLPWDERSYFATAVGTNIMSEVPWIGEWLKLVTRGGPGMGTLTISRFFVAHVFILPAGIIAFIGLHLLLFRKAGPAGPPSVDPVTPKGRYEKFYPKQVVLDAAFAFILIIILAVLAYFVPKALGPAANPADTAFIPRPEWYYRPIFQFLKYWEGPLAVIGILVVPGIIALLMLALPFYDRRLERRPWKRPVAAGIFSLVLLALIVLGIISYHVDSSNPGVAAQLAQQDKAEAQFMKQPFQPEMAAGSAAAAAAVSSGPGNPLIAKGKQLYASNGCIACHGADGAGAMAVKLIGVTQTLGKDKVAELIRHPNAKMKAGGMPAFPLSDDDMKALIAYLSSLK